MFDLCFLHSVSRLSSSTTCYSSPSTHDFTMKMNCRYGIENIRIRRLLVVESKRNKYREILRMIFSLLQNIRLSFFSARYDVIVIPYNNSLFLPFLRLYSFFCRKPLYIVCHGELEVLYNKTGGLLAKLTRYFIVKYISRKVIPNNIHFIVLGSSILSNLKPLIRKENMLRFHSINHPFYFSPIDKMTQKNDRRVRFGLVGTISPEKGLNELIILLDQFSNQLDVTVVGRVTDKKKELEMRGVKITDGYLPREEYVKTIMQIDCILFFYPCDAYKLIASGALFDVISLRKSIIALNNDYFRYIVKETKYPIFLVASLKEMKNKIDQFLENPDMSILDNYSDALHSFSIEYVSNQLRKIIL